MKLLFFCPMWGMAHLPLNESLRKIKAAGYDGVEFGCILNGVDKQQLLDLCSELDLLLIMQQYAAAGENIAEYIKDYDAHLRYMAGFQPVFINSQTGRDYYTAEQNIAILEVARTIEKETGIKIVHETHRGKFAYSPLLTLDYIKELPYLRLTGDFSHFCVVSESLLENQEDILHQIIPHVDHIHARIGHPQGAQVTDPRLPEWQAALEQHIKWWKAILDHHRQAGSPQLTITAEFGPAPYMPAVPFTQLPLASQWDINLYMTTLLKSHLK